MKNNWTKDKVDSACASINNEIYQKNRQSSLLIKLDDFSKTINTTALKRGVPNGLKPIVNDTNSIILKIEKLIIKSVNTKTDYFLEIQNLFKFDLWVNLRYLMINHILTPGEIRVLLENQSKINNELEKWEKAFSANR